MSLELKQHQVAHAEFMFDRANGVYNSSQPGTGKTATAITAMCKVRPERVLVVCPGSVFYNWVREIEMWKSAPYEAAVLDGTKAKRLKKLAAAGRSLSVVIVNYEMLNSIGNELIKFKPEMIICDEAHKTKNHKAICFKALKLIAERARTEYRWCLSGTPTPNNCLDIWSQFDFIRPGYLGPNFFAFRARYANVYTGAGFPQITGFKNQDELRDKLAVYTCRATKAECLDLPPVTFTVIDVELSDKNRKAYNSMANHMVAEVEGEKVSANITLTKMLRLQEMTSGFTKTPEGTIINMGNEKLETLMDLLESLQHEKVIVWCRFNHEIEKIRAAIGDTRKVHILRGGVTNEDRQKIFDEFQGRPDANDIILANVQVGGVGINLTACAYAIYFSRTFSFGDADQSQSRIDRLGQTRPVTYYDLVVRDSIDAYILKAVNKKESMSAHLTGDDVRRMVMGRYEQE